MKDELKPCPFCGGEVGLIVTDFEDGDMVYRPDCLECGCGWQFNFTDKKYAIESWNRRIPNNLESLSVRRRNEIQSKR